MNLYKRTIVGALLVASAFCGADVSFTAVIRDHKLSPIEAAAAVVLADAFGLDATFVISTGRKSNESLIVFGPALLIANECHRKPDEVWKLHKEGHGWGEIAKKMGMHPGTFNKLRKEGAFDERFWGYAASRSHGVSNNDYANWKRSSGGTSNALILIAKNGGNRGNIQNELNRSKSNSKSHSNHAENKSHGKGNSGHGKGHGKGKGG